MSGFLVFLLKSVAMQCLFLLFYRLVLRRSTFHHWNRAFLISSLLLSFLIPFFEIPTYRPEAKGQEQDAVFWVTDASWTYEQELVPVLAKVSTRSSWGFLAIVYVSFFAFFFMRSMLAIRHIYRLRRSSQVVNVNGFSIFSTQQLRPFSFFSSIFIPKVLFGTKSFSHVLAHEYVHVKCRHSIDRVLLDFLVSLFWFNPLMYWYRNALIEIHEYQADEGALHRSGNAVAYQEALYQELKSASYKGLVSYFNVQTIKRRIVMINTSRQPKMKWVYVAVLPLLLCVAMAFSYKKVGDPLTDMGAEIMAAMGPEPTSIWNSMKLISPVELKARLEPSVLPLAVTDPIKMTSRFGRRRSPFSNRLEHHNGIDLKAEAGTPVIAPADGLVLEAEYSGGFGNRIIIKHGEHFETRYAHLAKMSVKKGDKVKRGATIGLSGNTGKSTAPHLHYEVRKNGQLVDPFHYIQDFELQSAYYKEKAGKPSNEPYGALSKEAVTIVIDAGHGGKDKGLSHPRGWTEKEMTLDVARELAKKLEVNPHVKVVLTRDRDQYVSLQDRVLPEGDLLISLHMNEPKADAQPVVIAYSSENAFAKVSRQVAARLVQYMHLQSEGIDQSNLGLYESDYFLLKRASMPAVMLSMQVESEHYEDIGFDYQKQQKQWVRSFARAIDSAIM